jgi:hypothetical protein
VQVGASNKDIYGGDVKGKFGYGQRRIIWWLFQFKTIEMGDLVPYPVFLW